VAVVVSAPRPADVCRGLLDALDATDGRRRQRKRDTTPDAIGIGIKRDLLAAVVRDDPAPDAFEGWLLARSLEAHAGASVGAVRAMALEVLHEWRLVALAPSFQQWLEAGAPSADSDRAT
jgi:hypothetical protein